MKKGAIQQPLINKFKLNNIKLYTLIICLKAIKIRSNIKLYSVSKD